MAGAAGLHRGTAIDAFLLYTGIGCGYIQFESARAAMEARLQSEAAGAVSTLKKELLLVRTSPPLHVHMSPQHQWEPRTALL